MVDNLESLHHRISALETHLANTALSTRAVPEATTIVPFHIVDSWRWKRHNIESHLTEPTRIEDEMVVSMLKTLWRFMNSLHGDITNSLQYATKTILDTEVCKSFDVPLGGENKLNISIYYQRRAQKCFLGYWIMTNENGTVIYHAHDDHHVKVETKLDGAVYNIYGNLDVISAMNLSHSPHSSSPAS